MTTRTFKQTGQAYGAGTVSIVATIDGNVVYSGNLSTSDTPVPILPPDGELTVQDLFTWTADSQFTGTQDLSIEVTGGTLLLAKTVANYVWVDDPSNPGKSISGGADVYDSFYWQTVDGLVLKDPFTDETIDGVAQSTSPDSTYEGQWNWIIPAGSTFTATVNILAGAE